MYYFVFETILRQISSIMLFHPNIHKYASLMNKDIYFFNLTSIIIANSINNSLILLNA